MCPKLFHEEEKKRILNCTRGPPHFTYFKNKIEMVEIPV